MMDKRTRKYQRFGDDEPVKLISNTTTRDLNSPFRKSRISPGMTNGRVWRDSWLHLTLERNTETSKGVRGASRNRCAKLDGCLEHSSRLQWIKKSEWGRGLNFVDDSMMSVSSSLLDAQDTRRGKQRHKLGESNVEQKRGANASVIETGNRMENIRMKKEGRWRQKAKVREIACVMRRGLSG